MREGAIDRYSSGTVVAGHHTPKRGN